MVTPSELHRGRTFWISASSGAFGSSAVKSQREVKGAMAMSKAPSDSLVIESPWESRAARYSDICQVSAVPLTGYGVVCPSALGSLSDVSLR